MAYKRIDTVDIGELILRDIGREYIDRLCEDLEVDEEIAEETVRQILIASRRNTGVYTPVNYILLDDFAEEVIEELKRRLSRL